MKIAHFLNAGAWLANSVVWFFYAGVPFMGACSLAATGVAIYLFRSEI